MVPVAKQFALIYLNGREPRTRISDIILLINEAGKRSHINSPTPNLLIVAAQTCSLLDEQSRRAIVDAVTTLDAVAQKISSTLELSF